MDSAVESIVEQLPDRAQRQLEALRGLIEERLTLLEEVLTDPSRGESLEGIIVDLARLAGEEAQAVAAKAFADARSDAETRIAHAREAAQTAIEQERALSIEIRQNAEQAQLRVDSLEQEQLAHVRRVREELEAQAEQERAQAADYERAADEALRQADDALRQLDAERAINAELKQSRDDVQARLNAVESKAGHLKGDFDNERSTLRAAHEAERENWHREREEERARWQAERDEERSRWQAERESSIVQLQDAQQAVLAQARATHDRELSAKQSSQEAALAELQSAHEATLHQLQSAHQAEADQVQGAHKAQIDQIQAAHRAEIDQLQAAHDAAFAKAQSGLEELAEDRSTRQTLGADLERERRSLASLQRTLSETQSQLEAARAFSAELRRNEESAQKRLNALEGEHTKLRTAYQSLSSERAKAGANANSEVETLRAELQAASERIEVLDTERLRDREALLAELAEARQRIELFQANSQTTASKAPAAGPTLVETPPVVPASKHETKSGTKMLLGGEEGWGPVRLSNRYAFREPIPVQINGDSGYLFDLSITGCQLMSLNTMKPNQIVKVALPLEKNTLTCAGKVMWARFEPPASGRPGGYRAGVQFTKPDQDAIEGFITSRS